MKNIYNIRRNGFNDNNKNFDSEWRSLIKNCLWKNNLNNI